LKEGIKMDRKAKSDRILVLGIDGLDPRLTRKFVDKGIMPNMKKYMDAGASRHDLTMLGGHPTVTPSMWTTLATGAYSNVHGITGYWRNGEEIGSIAYNIDSTLCKAEQVWNCFAEAGKKTLVFHWPGSSWPPSSDSENLMVVDGSSPGAVSMAVCQVDTEFLVGARESVETVKFVEAGASDAIAPCVIDDLDSVKLDSVGKSSNSTAGGSRTVVLYKESQLSGLCSEDPLNLVESPIKPAYGWANAPADAKEFTVLLSGGLLRRPALILKNEDGVYDRVAIYKSKKESEPIVVCPRGEMIPQVVDEAIKDEVRYESVNRNYKLLRLAEDGSSLSMFVSAAMDNTNDRLWHPKRLHKEIVENVGYPPSNCLIGRQDPVLITECMLANWYVAADWHSGSILHLIETEKPDVVFSHFHNVDIQMHMFVKHVADKANNRNAVEVAEKWIEDLYIQTDYYLGKYVHLLDEGWTIFVISDHALLAAKHDLPLLFDPNGIMTPIMEDLGYTVLKRDENGNRIPEIDWTKTRAITSRDSHIYLNIKGRDKHVVDGVEIDGIVDPADQYELEEEIMTKLYQLTDKKTGHRIVGVALRNKDAVLLGQGGPEAGDIIAWIAEGYNIEHCDSLSTYYGEGGTSAGPIFVAAGKGIKKNYETDRIIRQIDFAPTVAYLGGVRMPAQCEGAIVYQILEEEF